MAGEPIQLSGRTESPATPLGLLTCMTCRVGFRDGDLQREHYKSDWHRYNLKRKIVQLPPVTVENFAERVAAQEAMQADSNKDTSQYCTICKKSFGNEKAFQSHVISKKHAAMVKEVSLQDSSDGKTPEKNQEVLSKELKSKCSVDDNIKASSSKSPVAGKKLPQSPGPIMKAAFIGKGNRLGTAKEADAEVMDLDEDDDDDSWEEIEGTPIPVTSCLFCHYESGDIESNIEHMSSNHSFFIPDMEYCVDVEGLMEYLGSKVGEGMMCLWCNEKGRQFYNVQAVQQHMQDKGHCKMIHDADAAFEYSDFYDYSPSYPDGAETVNPDGIYQPEILEFNESMQLVLPSGKALGHRALKVYYRQYVRPGSQLVSRRKEIRKSKILSQYKAIGYDHTAINIAQQKYRDQKYIKMIKDKYSQKVSTKGNKTLQTHFRCQVMF
ncbi:unnamed protein product [Orchesella dallaii]|uniref:C2H2-type domain-containing protein n=1 Tax=Orchesella dallaii TaxID=48710 RepID=A0ABP1PX24_9HEXA